MNIELLLKKGYFPKELPPPFTTKYFSKNFNRIQKSWTRIKNELNRNNQKIYKQKYTKKYKSSKCVLYSLPKKKKNFSRRIVEIPTPFHHSILCDTICERWTEIDNFYKKSVISLSKPIINEKRGRAAIPFKTFDNFKQECLITSFDKMYELKTDISFFYPTLYTHSIPWAMHGKENAKKDSSKHLLGNILDENIRNCKHGQSTGIPIGPDTSLIIAEIVSCGIDVLLRERLETVGLSIKGYRYYDDISFYFSSRDEAEVVLKTLQHILTDFQLSINEEKTDITIFPSAFDRNWVMQISSFEFRENFNKEQKERAREQRTDIERYFKLAFYYANKYPEDAVMGYAIKKFKSVPIMEENWNLFESLILKTTILNPITLKDIVPLLVAYNQLVDRKKICNVVEEIIKIHVRMGHSFEISWALWLAKTFNIKINNSIAADIFKSYDVIPILMALDLKSMNLIDFSVNLSSINENLTEDSLFEEKWILTYESIIHGWLSPISSNPLEVNEYFKILKDNNIKFYDETIKAKPLAIRGLNGGFPEIKPPVEVPPVEEYIKEPPEKEPTVEEYIKERPEEEPPVEEYIKERPEEEPPVEEYEEPPEEEPTVEEYEEPPEEETPVEEYEEPPEEEPPVEEYEEPPEEEPPEEDYSDEEDSSYY